MVLAVSIENNNTVRVSRHSSTMRVSRAFHPLFNTDMGLIVGNEFDALLQFSESFRETIIESSEDKANISTTMTDLVAARKLLGV